MQNCLKRKKLTKLYYPITCKTDLGEILQEIPSVVKNWTLEYKVVQYNKNFRIVLLKPKN